eukprot:TRINITY_DN8055_c0_g5_i2.p1 TRINITY_DN8055_c0_g5~~TRINITY_DN8055_c0_g5_i2.p1  ORF type:complete len:503 (-),score=42.56 TRINITY_DN8055_c0_g5_i2:201-1709(-)
MFSSFLRKEKLRQKCGIIWENTCNDWRIRGDILILCGHDKEDNKFYLAIMSNRALYSPYFMQSLVHFRFFNPNSVPDKAVGNDSRIKEICEDHLSMFTNFQIPALSPNQLTNVPLLASPSEISIASLNAEQLHMQRLMNGVSSEEAKEAFGQFSAGRTMAPFEGVSQPNLRGETVHGVVSKLSAQENPKLAREIKAQASPCHPSPVHLANCLNPNTPSPRAAIFKENSSSLCASQPQVKLQIVTQPPPTHSLISLPLGQFPSLAAPQADSMHYWNQLLQLQHLQAQSARPAHDFAAQSFNPQAPGIPLQVGGGQVFVRPLALGYNRGAAEVPMRLIQGFGQNGVALYPRNAVGAGSFGTVPLVASNCAVSNERGYLGMEQPREIERIPGVSYKAKESTKKLKKECDERPARNETLPEEEKREEGDDVADNAHGPNIIIIPRTGKISLGDSQASGSSDNIVRLRLPVGRHSLRRRKQPEQDLSAAAGREGEQRGKHKRPKRNF